MEQKSNSKKLYVKPTTEKSIEREVVAWKLRQRCYTQEQIADELEISQGAVSKILKKLSLRYSKELLEDIESVKAEQVAQLENIAAEAMRAWEKIAKLEEEKSFPNAAYLTAAMKAKEDIRKIIGADAAQRIQHSGDKEADAIKLDITTTRARLMDKLASIVAKKSD